MISIKLTYNKGFRWYSDSGISVKGIATDYEGNLLQGKDLIAYFEDVHSTALFESKLCTLNGLFTIIIHREEEVFASVDVVRDFPLLYVRKEDGFLLSDDYHSFISEIPGVINQDAKLYMRAFGYTPGRDTLIENVFQIRAGEYLHYNKGTLEFKYFKPLFTIPQYKADRQTAKKDFRNIWDKSTDILIRQINNRPIALPLSSGFDSRLIGLMLKKGGCKNVLCFTYGNRNSQEVDGSKEIAAKLGFPWIFIDYEQYIGEDYIHTPLFCEYVDYCGNAISFPYIQEYFAARYLREEYQLPENTVFIPGHSGDTIGGSHLYPDMEDFASTGIMARKIYNRKGKLITTGKEEKDRLTNILASCIDPEQSGPTHRMHDFWNIIERQSKQTVNSAKVWDFFGYEYLLPLWENSFSEFLLSLPFKYRVYKNFYDEILLELFGENNLLLEKDMNYSLHEKKYSYLKVRLKELIPFFGQVRKPNDSHFDFFHFRELLEPMLKELPGFRMNEKNAILTEWYIRKVSNELSSHPKES